MQVRRLSRRRHMPPARSAITGWSARRPSYDGYGDDRALGVRFHSQRGATLAVAAALLGTAGAALATVTPRGGRVPAAVTIVAPREQMGAIACPSVSECAAVGGNGVEVTFDPRRPRKAKVSRIDRFHSLFSIACPTKAQCTTAANPGRELTFDPRFPRRRTSALVLPAPTARQSRVCRDGAV